MFARIVGTALVLACLATPGQAQHVVTGTVRVDGGPGVARARVSVAGSGSVALTDSLGRYRLVIRGTLGATIAVRVESDGVGALERKVAVRGERIVADFVLPRVDRLAADGAHVPDGPVREYALDMRDAYAHASAPIAEGAAFAKSGSRGVSAGRRTGRGGAVQDSARAAELAAAGVLTAAVWDDLAHWKEYRRYLDGAAEGNQWKLDPSHATARAPIQKGTARSALDLGFLVDATGSMGDEMQFLQTELRDIVTRVRKAEPELDIRISIVFYRDRGDEFVTRALPFTRNVDSAVAFMEGTRADGGGDYPEDMNAGFATMMRQDWSSDVAPRMLFVIGDAPPQLYQDERYTYREAVGEAGKDRIALYPVAASGIDKPTEYLFRAMAAMTGGKYIFLTDDSGVGESHEKPDISGYEVEKLNELMVREIRKYVRSYLAPTAVAVR